MIVTLVERIWGISNLVAPVHTVHIVKADSPLAVKPKSFNPLGLHYSYNICTHLECNIVASFWASCLCAHFINSWRSAGSKYKTESTMAIWDQRRTWLAILKSCSNHFYFAEMVIEWEDLASTHRKWGKNPISSSILRRAVVWVLTLCMIFLIIALLLQTAACNTGSN